MFRPDRQLPHVQDEVLSQILLVSTRAPVGMPVDPDPDVVGKSLEKFDEVVRHHEAVVADVMPVRDRERS